MAHKYLVDLTEEEQGYLLDVIHKGKTAARRVGRAQVLLRAAEGAGDKDSAQTLHRGIASVHRIRQRLVDAGLTAALRERPRSGSPPVLTDKQAAFLVALACTTPPAGRHRWTLPLLTDRFIERRQIDTISAATVRRGLKKPSSNPGNGKRGVVPVSVPTMSGLWKRCWTCMLNPMIPGILTWVLTKARCS